MLTIDNCVAFTCGVAVIYLMFRGMGVFLFIACFSLLHASAQTNLVNVGN